MILILIYAIFCALRYTVVFITFFTNCVVVVVFEINKKFQVYITQYNKHVFRYRMDVWLLIYAGLFWVTFYI